MRVKFVIQCFGIIALVSMFTIADLSAGYYYLRNGRLVEESLNPIMGVKGHFEAGREAFKAQDWDELIRHFTIIKGHYSEEPHAKDADYYIGIAYFHKGDPDFANKAFAKYLSQATQPHFFEQAQVYRLEIAKQFGKGAKRHLFGIKKMPRWVSARSDAVKILDEIAISMPYQDIAARALYEQGKLFCSMGDYRDGADSFNLTIRRFPGDKLAIKSYLKISKLYLKQSKKEYQNPDLLDLAEINLMRFKKNFPGDENLEKLENNFQGMREIYAGGLLETGQYFQRKKKPKASAIYYMQALLKYPGTKASETSKERLQILQKKSDEIKQLIAVSNIFES